MVRTLLRHGQWCLLACGLIATSLFGWVSPAETEAAEPSAAGATAAADEQGFESLFDGQTLGKWDGDPKFWSVQDGALTGRTTAENPTPGNTFLVYRGGELGDFELRLQFRIVGGNSGIQYRSREVSKWVIGGYQADFDAAGGWTGTLYDERGRGVLAKRGTKVEITADGQKKAVGNTTAEADILASIKKEDWNDYTIVARGNHLVQSVNGLVTVDVTDHQEDKRSMSGLLALQLHAGPPMTVQFRNIRYRKLAADKPDADRQDASAESAGRKKVIFLAGRPSHGYGAHEHYAGCVLLAKALQQGMPNIDVEVHRNGWPADAKVLDGADAIVMYADGGGGHPVMPHLAEMDRLANQGVGIACIHYAVEIPKGEPGDHLLDWIGGYFEAHWSVNPHWVAEFKELPEHPITRGVKPFAIEDEWYYHMRFRPEMRGVTPILTAVPPASTLSRPDGPHSGNPHVRKTAGQPQHVAWAAEREGGGRGFGFTGGHFHWNWGDDNFRKVVLNALVWVAGGEVPAAGVSDKQPTVDDLKANQDFTPPANFNDDVIRRKLGAAGDSKQSSAAPGRRGPTPKPIARSPIITPQTPGHAVELEADIQGARQLFLMVTDAGNGFSCDWADWAEPELIGPEDKRLKLTELRWKSATTDFGQVRVNQNVSGGPLRIAGKSVEFGIGTHANSVIAYDLPAGITKFRARVGLDNGGTDQGNCGASASVQFLVFTEEPQRIASRAGGAGGGSREADDAVSGLDVAEGLEATLFASEPSITSLTNLDIDARGRIWVCEVVNYRRNNGQRPEGDRILILEDTDGDGVADKTKVFYQGHDVDSAMGICVLGNRVIVSCSPNILVFTDADGDDVPDKKELLFTKTGQPQHDHSSHSFLFGPDGKLYWNFGNTGQAVHDKDGNPVVDLAGNRVVDNGKPYFGGMPFRCNLDGSQFEVLGHNFRNNYEVTVDSFGSLWQSDNDDDGNRGVRINWVIEFGNYGYRDEMTGAGWNTPRTNLEDEIPLRHWHLNDPGVVPNLLQTGAGSPTGICVYEGRLLPKAFWDQVIHCDAGPNIVRAYPARRVGAGYEAEMVDLLHGARDNWFRPADVCVAPDGSLFVTDWYDPGVGGHAQGDLDRGRIFRIAPPGHKYQPPKLDLESVAGAIEALKNPNGAVRYLAWTRLQELGTQAEPALQQMFQRESNPRLRARALWVLGKLPGRGEYYVAQALTDQDPDLRIVGLRLARQLQLDLIPLVERVVRDASPAVRAEAAIALRHQQSGQAADLWAELALQHDGQDRWYLEALGIGADGQWDRYLEAWRRRAGEQWNASAGRDIVWRSRSAATPQLLAQLIASGQTPDDELPRLLRAFDFQAGEPRTAALVELAFAGPTDDSPRTRLITGEALARLKGFDVSRNPQHAAALERVLDSVRGSSQFVELVAQFNLAARFGELLALAQAHADEELGIQAVRALLGKDQQPLLTSALQGDDLVLAAATARALGNTQDGRTVGLLLPLIRDAQADPELRRQATRAVAATTNGAKRLLELAQQNSLDDSLKESAAFGLNNSADAEVRSAAARLFPLPPARNNETLPPISELLKRTGDAGRGKLVFEKSAECAKCHLVRGQGKEVGPDLSEIGGKLSRQALFESILYPSAGISHNYETWALALDSGNVVTGVLVSQTDDTITIKSADAIARTFNKSEIEEQKKQNISLMPADLQKTMNVQELLDVVEYLATLKKP
ncbi:MAG: DUF1080 domain-containing protein [Pirellulaceae bacterium]|nr:DUF1080 domain-containing protein [Pirellulaceae bacterium]